MPSFTHSARSSTVFRLRHLRRPVDGPYAALLIRYGDVALAISDAARDAGDQRTARLARSLWHRIRDLLDPAERAA